MKLFQHMAFFHSSFPAEMQKNINAEQQGIIRKQKPGVSPRIAVHFERRKRPEKRRREKLSTVRRNIHQNMQSPSEKRREPFFAEAADDHNDSCKNDKVVREVIERENDGIKTA